MKDKRTKSLMLATASTYRAAIPQWPPDFFPASMKRERPMRLMVGAMASGPMYLSTKPTTPERPRTSWSKEETRMAPWICENARQNQHRFKIPFCYSVSGFTVNSCNLQVIVCNWFGFYSSNSLTITDYFSFHLWHGKRRNKVTWSNTCNKHAKL